MSYRSSLIHLNGAFRNSYLRIIIKEGYLLKKPLIVYHINNDKISKIHSWEYYFSIINILNYGDLYSYNNSNLIKKYKPREKNDYNPNIKFSEIIFS